MPTRSRPIPRQRSVPTLPVDPAYNVVQGCFDTAPAGQREPDVNISAADKVARKDAERVYNAGVMARTYPQTTAAQWLAWYAGGYVEDARPVTRGTPILRVAPKTGRVEYHGVLVEQHGEEWRARTVVSVIEFR